MSNKFRTIFFSAIVILFLLVTPSVIFYSLGYRIDFNSKKIIKTGAFYFKVWPRGAEIFFDGKSKKKTDFLLGSAYISDLLPKTYKVEIKKEGFLTWQKNLEIKENEVTEAKNVFLIPANPRLSSIDKEVEDFLFSPDGKSVVLKKTGEDGWSLEFLNLETDLKTEVFSEKTRVELVNLEFSFDSGNLLLETREKNKTNYLVLELEKTPINKIPLDFLGSGVKKNFFDPDDNQTIFIFREEKGVNYLYKTDLTTKKVSSQPILKDFLIYDATAKDLFFIRNDGFLFRTDFLGNNQEKLSQTPILIQKESSGEDKILSDNSTIFLLNKGDLYLLDSESKEFKNISENINNLEFSPDGKKLFFANNYEVWILFLEKKYDQPQKEALDQLFLTRFSERIDRIFWYTSGYLIFNVGNKIKTAEIDNRDKINIFDLADFNNPKVFFNQYNKKLYILSDNNFLSSDKLLP
jgi:WD40 repeat protein